MFAKMCDFESVSNTLSMSDGMPVEVMRHGDFVLYAFALEGEKDWHSHAIDEFYFVYKGHLTIYTKEEKIELVEGQGAFIAKDVVHRGVARERVVVFFIPI